MNEARYTNSINPHNTWPVDTTSERSLTPSGSASYMAHCPTQGWALHPGTHRFHQGQSSSPDTVWVPVPATARFPLGLFSLGHRPPATTASFLGHATPLSHSLVLSFTLTHSWCSVSADWTEMREKHEFQSLRAVQTESLVNRSFLADLSHLISINSLSSCDSWLLQAVWPVPALRPIQCLPAHGPHVERGGTTVTVSLCSLQLVSSCLSFPFP